MVSLLAFGGDTDHSSIHMTLASSMGYGHHHGLRQQHRTRTSAWVTHILKREVVEGRQWKTLMNLKLYECRSSLLATRISSQEDIFSQE